MCQPYREFFGEELGGSKQRPYDTALVSNSHGLLPNQRNPPVEGRSPNCTICLKLTPVAGKLE